MKIEFLQTFANAMTSSVVFKFLMLVVVLDTLLGVLRAIKYRKFNSSAGIDGAIRKVVSAVALMAADLLVHANVAFMIPNEYLQVIGLTKVGLCELFSLLFILYECVSILKNMVLCGLPVSAKMRDWLEEFLKDMTTELPEEIEEQNQIEQK